MSKEFPDNKEIDTEFSMLLFKRLWASQLSEYQNNYDEIRFGPYKLNLKDRIKYKIRHVLAMLGLYHKNRINKPNWIVLKEWLPLLQDLEWVYSRLSDDKSKSLLVDIIAHRIMGHIAVRLPLGTEEYKKRRKELESLSNPDDKLDIKFNGWFLSRYNLEKIGYPISLYLRNPSTLFDIQQYAYDDPVICAKEGDVVIDGGGCYGDTALYFANKVGLRGAVHTFEFVPSNLNIMRKNLALNPQLSPIISIERSALWSVSGALLHVLDDGPGSRVGSERVSGSDLKVETCSIDDYVERKELPRVDFIKLDIEGAEEQAIIGAEKTIRNMRPTMAVCLYHSPLDFVRLPRLLDQYCSDYIFYIKHATMHSEETVLFAKVNDDK